MDQPPAVVGGEDAVRATIVYPTLEERAGVEGTVLLWLVVGQDGRPRDVQVTRGVSPGIDREAVEAVYRLRFEPAVLGGQPVTAAMRLPVRFRLAQTGK